MHAQKILVKNIDETKRLKPALCCSCANVIMKSRRQLSRPWLFSRVLTIEKCDPLWNFHPAHFICFYSASFAGVKLEQEQDSTEISHPCWVTRQMIQSTAWNNSTLTVISLYLFIVRLVMWFSTNVQLT